jgi:hypothetical protein
MAYITYILEINDSYSPWVWSKFSELNEMLKTQVYFPVEENLVSTSEEKCVLVTENKFEMFDNVELNKSTKEKN